MKGIFKKLTRYTIRCAVCGKSTDTMTENEDQAKYYFLQKGWLNYAVKGQDGKPSSMTVCKKQECKRIMEMVILRPVEDQENKIMNDLNPVQNGE